MVKKNRGWEWWKVCEGKIPLYLFIGMAAKGKMAIREEDGKVWRKCDSDD
jgi:hypothetical protein